MDEDEVMEKISEIKLNCTTIFDLLMEIEVALDEITGDD